MGLVIDTSALISLERGSFEGSELPFGDESIVLPAIVWAEALIGVRVAGTPERAARRRGFLEKVRLLTSLEVFGDDAAERYAGLYVSLRKSGSMIPQNDLQVAALALSLGFGVLVGKNDESYFRLVPELRVECLG